MSKLVVFGSVIFDDLRVRQSQLDISKATIFKGLVGLLDGQREQILRFANVEFGHVAAVEQHYINGDILRFERNAACVGKWLNLRFGDRWPVRRFWSGLDWNAVDPTARFGMLCGDLAPVHSS